MTYFFHEGKEEQWKSIGRDDIRKYRNKMISHLKEVEESGEPLVWTPELAGPSKRGIILTGGEGVSLPLDATSRLDCSDVVSLSAVVHDPSAAYLAQDAPKDARMHVADRDLPLSR